MREVCQKFQEVSVHKPQNVFKNFSSLDLTFANILFFLDPHFSALHAPDIPTSQKFECAPGY